MIPNPEPTPSCSLCPRLVAFRVQQRSNFPDWFNAPVPSFGPEDARLLIVGLAPGLKGANRTGRPFTGDYAGDLLYATLGEFRFAIGEYAASPNDSLRLRDVMITNAVRCVPPQNKPTPEEIKTCRGFLRARIQSLVRLRAILALGRIAHDSTLAALGLRRSQFTFGHGKRQDCPAQWSPGHEIALFDSYHCSRYNTNTGRLTPDMFRSVFRDIRDYLNDAAE